MNGYCRWEVLLISLWIQVGFVPGILCKDGTVSHFLREDALLITDEQDPKCFSRTEEDFTCFFVTAENRAYDLLYKFDNSPTGERCAMSAQRTEEGTFLQICSFPDTDVLLFVKISLEVVERNSNITLYNRTVSVEDQILLAPPFNVFLHQNDQAGQLRVSWQTEDIVHCVDLRHRIRYSFKGPAEKTTEVQGNILDSLLPGEVVQVQVSVKCGLVDLQGHLSGHWSSWSQPVQGMVPEYADDVSLICFTSDLQNITCQWNGSKYGEEKGYKLFYKTCLSDTSNWTEWVECLANKSFTGLCHFLGDKSKEFLVKLSGSPAPLSRTFFTQKFTLNNSVRTSPPGNLRGALEKDKLCLQWEAPLLSVFAHLQYEVGYQTNGGEGWMTVSLEGPANGTCLDVAKGTHYSVKVRAKPKGSIYSGYWSDWSDVLTGDTPPDTGMLLILCIPLLLVTTTVILFSLFSMYLSKLKQYFWPPVPNLDKVLQGFLTEINGQKWDLSVTVKQCCEDTTPSVVEIMSEDKVSGLGKPSQESIQLLSPEGSFSSSEKVDERPGTEIFPDYVTLNKDSTIICPKGNKYVYEQVGEKGEPVMGDEFLQTCSCSCTDSSVCVSPCLCTDYLNQSYLPLAETADRSNCKVTAPGGPGNLYANVPCS